MSSQRALGVKVTCPVCRKKVNATINVGVPVVNPIGGLIVPTTSEAAHNCGPMEDEGVRGRS